MRRANRSISILSMSALDVLAMATGVFVLLLVLLMPYYRKTFDANAEIEAARVAASASLAEVQALERTAARHSDEAEAAAAAAAELNARAAALEQAARSLEPEPVAGADDSQRQVIEAIDLVFVIDTTASMTPVIRELAVSVRSIVRILQRLVPSVRIGISAYKDRDTGLPPVITFPLTATDPYLPRIVGFIESLDASPVGSRTLEEDVHLGLEAATLMPWRSDARQVMVVIGDAAAHAEYQNETFWRARDFVRDNELRTLATLFVTTPSSLEAGQRARPYFQALANAADGTFNDHTGSMIESVLLSVLVD